MKTNAFVAVAVAALCGPLVAQEYKPVPKDSIRVFIPGCTKGLMFTAGPRTEDQPGRSDIPEGMHFRMNGPKKMMEEIRTRDEGSMIEITGLIRKGQYGPDGVGIGHGVRITPRTSPTGGRLSSVPHFSRILIGVEARAPVVGDSRSW